MKKTKWDTIKTKWWCWGGEFGHYVVEIGAITGVCSEHGKMF